AMIAPQIDDDSAPGGYYRLFRDIREWLPKDVVLCSEGATTMDIGGTQMPLANPRSYMNAGTYGTMGVGLGLVVAACGVHPNRPIVHVSGHDAFGGKGFWVEDPRDLRGALDEAMNFPGPALVNVKLSQGSARKPQEFRWH